VEVFGRPREEVIGTRIDQYLPESERATVQAEYDRYQRDGEFSAERRYIRADGTVVRVQYAAHAETVTGRELALFVSHVMDSAEEKADTAPTERNGGAISNGDSLSPREREVVHHVAMGMTSRQIAEELTVSTETVRTHIRNALAKTGTRTRAQLVAQVMGSGSLADE
jgi:DNA-binding CsgD family transcriptional regulator